MTDQAVGVACVGLGRWADVIAQAVGRTPKLKLASCFTRSAEKREAFARKFGCDEAATYEELLADERVDAVLVTTPNHLHAESIEQAAAAGKHVWVEKPIAHTLADARRIDAAVRRADVTFAVGHSARMLGASRKMKELLAAGDLGNVMLIEANFSNDRGTVLTPERWRYYAANSPGGPLAQLLVHHFDTLQYLLGPIAEVQAYKRRLHTQAEVDDVVSVIAQFEAGYLAHIGSNWTSPGVYSINLYGSRANLYHALDFARWTAVDVDRHTTLLRQANDSSDRTAVDIPTKDMFRDELEDFADAIRTGRPPEVGYAEATRALAVVEAAIRSADGRRPVTLAEVLA